eukprot:CAMPEP_0179166780 /NCGR_PEP_ID=MMETSP0796-20121207/81958_1 /TAXON_ID=73915 /ORGANISM="Pyrodinium bahamense, Strain pbaha01" /LENGTH=49 /DNA_ID= /DNA_START= /DNA_END= /DNA_ORIENTATION=
MTHTVRLAGGFSAETYPDLANVTFEETRRLNFLLDHPFWYVPDVSSGLE